MAQLRNEDIVPPFRRLAFSVAALGLLYRGGHLPLGIMGLHSLEVSYVQVSDQLRPLLSGSILAKLFHRLRPAKRPQRENLIGLAHVFVYVAEVVLHILDLHFTSP